MFENLPHGLSGYLSIIGMLTVRYFIFCGLFFVFFYVWRKRKHWLIKIQQKWPKNQDIQREILTSLSSMFIFSLVFISVFWLARQGYTRIYYNMDQYGWFYFFASLPLFILVHDTYFYWTHRLMHWKVIFKYVHLTHHRSTNPTPWAAFAFHPLEAVIEAGIMPLLAFVFPAHPLMLFLFGLYQQTLNVSGHCGYEFLPAGFTQHWFFKWFNTPTHHNMHHSKFSCNYGLYFNIWDRIMGTNHKNYHTVFEEVKNRKAEPETELELAPKAG